MSKTNKKQTKSNLDISQKLTGKNGFKYFFRNFNYKLSGKSGYFDKLEKPELPYHKYIIPDELINCPVNEKDNIIGHFIIDTEFTSYYGNNIDLTKEKLQNLDNRQLIQIQRLDKLIKERTPDLKGIYELTENREIKQINAELLNKVNIQAIPTINLTTQIKHALYDDAEILINPDIKNFYEQNVSNPDYHYPAYDRFSQCHIFDFLKLKGLQIEIGNKNEVDKEEFKKYPTCTFKLYAYFLLADLSKIFQTLPTNTYEKILTNNYGGEEAKQWVENQLFTDLKKAFQKKKITQDRRLKTNSNNGFCQQWHTQRLITINGLKYRLVFDLIDLGAMQGAISLNSVLENLGMDTSNKNLLDDVKDNMLLAMIERPEEFKKYALGDLVIYDAFKKHNDLFKKAYEELGLKNYFTEVKLTTGATTNDLQQATLLKNLGLNIPNTENIKNLKYFTNPATSKNLKTSITKEVKNLKESELNKHFLSKTNGGRCYNNRQAINTASKDFTLVDIDIAGAYSTTASVLPFYYGCPVIIGFKKGEVTVREFFKHYEKKYLIKRGFKIAIETKENKPLTIEQDFIQSWIKIKIAKELKTIDGTNEYAGITTHSVDLDNTPTAILTRELRTSTLTWDEVNIIMTEWTNKQRDEFLDNVYMKSALFYPKNFECKSIKDLFSKKTIHKRFSDTIPNSYIVNDDGEYNHYWYATNFGKLGLDKIIQKRAEYKKTNPSLAYLYKLIGNTLYGINVSKYFEISNILLAANITAMCRCGMYLTEKALNIYQTITDGGIFNLNEVIHKIERYKKNIIDTSSFVRAYQKRNEDLSKNHKWKNKPITENGKKIEFHQGKGWLIDDKYYGNINRDIYVKLSKDLEEYKKNYDENHELTKQKEIELKPFEEEIKKLFTKINELVKNHIRKVFPNNDIFNNEFEKVKVDEKGLAIKDKDNNFIYEKTIGLYNFEVKNICNSVSFHGSADYMYTNLKSETTTKMRGYDVKPNVVAWKLENNKLIPDTNYYNENQPIKRFLENLQYNPESVRIQPPFTKTSILKPAQFSKEYNKTFQHTDLKCGDDFMEIVKLPIFTLRFKFQTEKQLKAWTRYYNSLKRRYGLSFEIFYLNIDGTINYKKMIYEIDKYISEGVIYPQNIYDKNRNLKREMQNNKYVQENIYLINWLKNLVRFTIVGGKQFIAENYKLEKEVKEQGLEQEEIKLIWWKTKKQNHYTTTNYNSWRDVNSYSNDNAFRDFRDFRDG